MGHFWQGGEEAYLAALRRQRDQRIDALDAQLKVASTAVEIQELEDQIRHERHAYRQRIRGAGYWLF